MQNNPYLHALGAEIPIIQAPMAGVQGSALAVAVCRAGGVGSLPAAMLTPEKLREELAAIRDAVGGKPYNVNFFAHRNPEVSEAQKAAWFDVLKPYFEEFGLTQADIPAGGGRNPFDETALEMVQAFKPPVVSFHFGLPEKPLLEAVKATGAQVWSSASTVEEARWLEANGADAVIAQGWEAGGHRGMFLSRDLGAQSGTFALLPNIVAAVKLPVIAAGGISNAQTVRAAFDLGAAAVQPGTAFLLADEATTSAAYRAALQSPRAGHTVITNLFSGGFARGIANRFIREAGPINASALPFPFSGAAAGVLKAAAERAGSDEFSSFWAGQNARFAQAGSAEEILHSLAEGLAG
ncbi:nitronate monooxygenase family protein [Neisseria sp. 83E34]|uniref:NAD(P)H-dependent flavin oxidoreductase n=1 Tax=Neisseria sp. 83E34 TaxID=1692264 RepID=UPI0006CEAA31|nr:nitronate monooxygenase [Neisseria sp. 83E34]KPN72131.1 2-nitropropane dioxygenase [Neisseria sp. 83E34]